jgi:hypothetical protein
VVKALASFGAGVNSPMHNGWTPLCGATQMGYLEVVQAPKALGAV